MKLKLRIASFVQHTCFCLAFFMHDRLSFDVCMQLLSVAPNSEDSANVSGLLCSTEEVSYSSISRFWKTPRFDPSPHRDPLLSLPRFDIDFRISKCERNYSLKRSRRLPDIHRLSKRSCSSHGKIQVCAI